jgi:hypothetical protein
MSVVFTHPNTAVGTLRLRLPPTAVDWSYKANTNVINTYAGQVVQLLSINFEKLTITGQFGREGAHGRVNVNAATNRERNVDGFRDYRHAGRLAIGLTQMTEYFRNYFEVASAGKNSQYDQAPMTLRYTGALNVDVDVGRVEEWSIYPVSFPSYRRSNEDFAPEWRVEAEIHEPPLDVKHAAEQETFARLSKAISTRSGVGFRPNNEFSDPMGRFLYPKGSNTDLSKLPPEKLKELVENAKKSWMEETTGLFDHLGSLFPATSEETLRTLILGGASMFTWTRNDGT